MKKHQPIQPVHDPRLSLWQSAARAVAHDALTRSLKAVSSTDLYNHPLVLAATEHAQFADPTPSARPKFTAAAAAAEAPRFLARGTPEAPNPAYLSALHFEHANAQLRQDGARLASLEAEIRKYSSADPAWITCEAAYVLFSTTRNPYRSWMDTPEKLGFSVIDYRLPNDAIVGVLGDWGTGQDDAVQLLKAMITGVQRQYGRAPDAIIHLGDVYYSGVPSVVMAGQRLSSECRANFLDVLTKVFDETLGKGKRIPVFSIPGNHEYYCMGLGFFQEILPETNAGVPGAQQPASYFCLRTKDDTWQFLGMDTGYNSGSPAGEYLSPEGPDLREDESTWHYDKLDNFSGKTILLSHHQLFSANAQINSGRNEPPNFNTHLQRRFGRYFHKVAAWLWGHEHNLALYANNLVGLAKGRLIGASSYEESTGEAPYNAVYDGVPYLEPNKYQLGADQGFYNHAYAVIDFARAKPSDAIAISYFQYPSWANQNPKPPASSAFIFKESLDVVPPPTGEPIKFGDRLTMQMVGSGYLGPIPAGNQQYYPEITPLRSALVSLVGGSGTIQDGSVVEVQTTEATAGAYNLLGVWTAKWLYYYTYVDDRQTWKVRKRDTSYDKIVRYGDQFWLESNSSKYSGQWMAPVSDAGKQWLTTVSTGDKHYWTCQPSSARGAILNYGDTLNLEAEFDGKWRQFGPEKEFSQYFPTLVPSHGITLQVLGASGPISSGAMVQMKTLETAVGGYNLLGAFSKAFCYWYSAYGTNTLWQMVKRQDTGDNMIRRGDLVKLVSLSYFPQQLCPRKDGDTYYVSTIYDGGDRWWRVI